MSTIKRGVGGGIDTTGTIITAANPWNPYKESLVQESEKDEMKGASSPRARERGRG